MNNTSVIEALDRSPSTVPNPIQLTVVRANTLFESIRKRKFIWILIFIIIIVIAIAVTIPLVFSGEKKMKTDTSTTVTTTVTITTIVTTTAITTATYTEVSLNNSIITNKSKWKQNGTIVAGGHGRGQRLDQLNGPTNMYLDDDDQTIYISEIENHRVVEWKFNATSGRIVAGGNGLGNELNQLVNPSDVIVDKTNDSIIICDLGNTRIVRWSRQNSIHGDIIISNVACYSVAMDNNGYLYIGDRSKFEVRRWKIGDDQGILVAGGNGLGYRFDQLYEPSYIFVDADYSVYVSDWYRDRVMKWARGAKTGIVVAGRQTEEGSVMNSSFTSGITVDQLGNVYVVMMSGPRVMRWFKGATEGSIIIDEYKLSLFPSPGDLAFDKYGNLYLLDTAQARVQKFLIETY